jgi:hypothetical protein
LKDVSVAPLFGSFYSSSPSSLSSGIPLSATNEQLLEEEFTFQLLEKFGRHAGMGAVPSEKQADLPKVEFTSEVDWKGPARKVGVPTIGLTPAISRIEIHSM